MADKQIGALAELAAERDTQKLATMKEIKALGRAAGEMIYEPRGCSQCLNTGFSGRRAIFELLVTNDDLKEVMLSSPTLRQLREAAGPNFSTLRDHGNYLVSQGVTTFEEIDRVIGAG